MYYQPRTYKQTMKGIKAYRAESIEDTIKRMMSNKEPIEGTVTAIYTDRKEGIAPDYDIRTDKFEFLVEGKDAISKTKRAQRDNIGKLKEKLEEENDKLNKKDPPEGE